MTDGRGTEVIDSPPDLAVVAGVDTHADTHHVAVLSPTGARLGDLQVPATPADYDDLLVFVRSFGVITLVGSRAPAPDLAADTSESACCGTSNEPQLVTLGVGAPAVGFATGIAHGRSADTSAG